MTNKHTPWPWAWKTTSGYDYGSISYWIPGVCTNIKTEANARLIAAAPELLEALLGERRLRLLGQEPDVHWESLRDERRAAYAATDAAIAKATGAQP